MTEPRGSLKDIDKPYNPPPYGVYPQYASNRANRDRSRGSSRLSRGARKMLAVGAVGLALGAVGAATIDALGDAIDRTHTNDQLQAKSDRAFAGKLAPGLTDVAVGRDAVEHPAAAAAAEAAGVEPNPPTSR